MKNDEVIEKNIKDNFAAVDLMQDKYFDRGIFGGNRDSVDWHVSCF